MSSFPFSRGPKFLKCRDAGRKFQLSESLSHSIPGVFILQEPKTAENRKLYLENDEAQAQRLNQGRIFKKMAFFIKL
jgi:hypothetical protein